MSTKKHKICPLPWLSLSTESQRELRLCCHESGEERSGIYLEDFNTTLEAFNHDYFKKARQLMLKGQFPAACIGCKKLEESTGHSPRLEYLERFQSQLEPLLQNTDQEGLLGQAKLVYLDVTTDNHCNLKCRMCRPRYSHKILADWNQMGWNPGENEVRGISIDLSQKVYEDSLLIEENFKNLKMITLTGGEPFLSPAVKTLLERVIHSGFAPQISLRFFTNTTLVPEKLKDYLKQFREVNLFCSIDGYGSTSDYIRYPSKWSTIDNTYRAFVDLLDEHPNLHLNLHTVVQAYNLTQLTSLFNFLAGFKGKVPLLPSFTHVDSSLPLSTCYLPVNLIERAKKDFESFLEENDELLKNTHQAFHARETTNYQAILDHAHANNEPEKFVDFVVYSKKMDKIRGQSLQKQYPEFKL